MRRLCYLRLDPPEGDGFTSVAEVAAYCALPKPWLPVFVVEPVPLFIARQASPHRRKSQSKYLQFVLPHDGQMAILPSR
jgi:hypothetical protein